MSKVRIQDALGAERDLLTVHYQIACGDMHVVYLPCQGSSTQLRSWRKESGGSLWFDVHHRTERCMTELRSAKSRSAAV
eukprot:6054488-Prymnesium_polylepis.1